MQLYPTCRHAPLTFSASMTLAQCDWLAARISMMGCLPWRAHRMEVLLGCEWVVEGVNVMDPMAERRRTDATEVDDTEDPES